MKNASKKIQQALTIIRKFYSAVNVQRTDNEDIVYLFDYSANKKTVGSDKIAKAVEKATKQQDFPKDVFYSEGMLTIIKEQIEEVIPSPKIEENVSTNRRTSRNRSRASRRSSGKEKTHTQTI
jgi:hypothetical protein